MKNIVRNVPEYAWDYPVWVVTDLFDEGVWFYGAWPMDKKDRANEIAMELGKMVILE